MAHSILLIDRETHIRRILAYKLRCEGFLTHTAASADEARDILAETAIDLAVIDIALPTPDLGFDFAEDLKRRTVPGDLPVIILSGDCGPDEIKRSHDLPAAGFITKPFSINFVLRRIRAILN